MDRRDTQSKVNQRFVVRTPHSRGIHATQNEGRLVMLITSDGSFCATLNAVQSSTPSCE